MNINEALCKISQRQFDYYAAIEIHIKKHPRKKHYNCECQYYMAHLETLHWVCSLINPAFDDSKGAYREAQYLLAKMR